ncbi:transcription factor bHLH18-like [Gastrolobium bilobum]|uniref:transcription factor bHLH18-like n=1 Tax=Gastrolobium bilobum TaxID=150636 RepID=UPI002AB1CAF1|nr:transcription factor bHLH18-like [Gastrolobium bilobum]
MMEIASTNYLPELGMEDHTFFHQYPMDSFACSLDDFDFQSFCGSPESNSSYQYFNSESTPNCFPAESPNQSVNPTRPKKKLKTFSDFMAPKASSSSSSSSQLISFEHFNAPSIASHQFHNLDSDLKICLNNDNRANQLATTARNPTQAQEHVIAERKRREKLSQSFIALSAIVPGLKKMDKASVLEDAIKYVKQLKERVQTLEEQSKKKVGSVKRSILFANDENSESHCEQPHPDMEVIVSGKDALIRIHCDKQSWRAATILSELEKNHLIVQSCSFFPFGNNTIAVTIVAQMNKENCITAKDLIGSLRQFI